MTICVNRDDAKRDFGMLFLAARQRQDFPAPTSLMNWIRPVK